MCHQGSKEVGVDAFGFAAPVFVGLDLGEGRLGGAGDAGKGEGAGVRLLEVERRAVDDGFLDLV